MAPSFRTTFRTNCQSSLKSLPPVWAALRGDYYNSQEEHVGHNSHAPWQNGTVNGNNVYATHTPLPESQYSTSSRVKCVQSTHEQRVSVWATHSKVCTNHSKCQSVWCAQTQSCFFILHYWALWWLCYELVPWPTQLCFMLAGSGQGWQVVQTCCSPL